MILERDDKTWRREPSKEYAYRGWKVLVYVMYRVFVLEGDELKGSYTSRSGGRGKQYKLINDFDHSQAAQSYRCVDDKRTVLPSRGIRILSLTYCKEKHIRVAKAPVIKLKISNL